MQMLLSQMELGESPSDTCIIQEINDLEGAILKDTKVCIDQFYASGSSSILYSCIDIIDREPKIIKFSQCIQEISAESIIQKKQGFENYFGTVHITDYKFQERAQQINQVKITSGQQNTWFFVIMKQYGSSLNKYFQNKKLSLKTVVQVGIQILDSLEKLHAIGYVHNDLKPDNILIGDSLSSKESMHQVHLIDFGFASQYLQNDGTHVEQSRKRFFRGNIAFASSSQLDKMTTSRKDDLESLCYMLVYLVGAKLDFDVLKSSRPFKKREWIFELRRIRSQATAEEVCHDPLAKDFVKFLQQVFQLSYEEAPDYQKLRFTLKKIILDRDEVPNNDFDWSYSQCHDTKKQNFVEEYFPDEITDIDEPSCLYNPERYKF